MPGAGFFGLNFRGWISGVGFFGLKIRGWISGQTETKDLVV